MLALAGVALWSAWLEAATQAPPGPFRIISDVTLTSVRFAMDVRWSGERTVVVAGARAGLLEVPVDGGPPRVVIPGGSSKGGFWLASRVAASNGLFAIAAPSFSLAWKGPSQTELMQHSFEFIVDLDVAGDRLAVLGAEKDERGFAPDGAIAWIATLGSKELTGLKPIYYSVAGPVARPMADCGMLETGAVRFLQDGSLVLVPGVEPGVFLYDRTGRLVRTWETRDLGIDAECGVNEAEKKRIAVEIKSRVAWLEPRRVVEDVLPLPQGPGLIVRSVAGGATRWQLKVLLADQRIATYDLPFTASPRARIRADLRDGKIVFLIREMTQTLDAAPPARLVVTTAPR